MSENFYGRNATRCYPLDDAASGLADDGRALPPDVLVDCSLRFPASLATTAFVSAVTVTPGLVTIAIEGARRRIRPSLLEDPPGPDGFIPLGSVAVLPPFPRHEPLPIEPAADGVAGWVVLGPGLDEPYAGRFSTPEQGALLPRCARAYRDPPFSSLGRWGGVGALRGVVTLAAGNDVSVTTAGAVVDGLPVLAARVGLRGGAVSDPLAAYVGPCGARPESGTCVPPPIEFLNDATPDAAGNIDIEFEAADVYPLLGGGGFALDVPVTLDELCPGAATPGTPAADTADGCGTKVVFGASPPPLRVVAGAFAAGPGGFEALGPGLSLAVTPRSPAPRLLRAQLAITTSGASPQGAGGIVFGYREGGPGDPSYCLAMADLGEGVLYLARPGGAVVAAAALGRPAQPRDFPSIVGLEMRVMIGEPEADAVTSTPDDLRVPVTVEVHGRATAHLTGHVPRAAGECGIAATGHQTTFGRFDAEDTPSAS